MPVVTLDRAVVQRTNRLKYLEIHFHRMLTYGQPVETTAQKCNKGLSVLEAKATKGIEQRHLLLLYVTVVFSITDYGPGLTKNGTDKSAKAGQSAERGNDSHVGNHQWHTH